MEILGIDIGGSGIKGAPVDVDQGLLTAERYRLPTPQPATPEAVADMVAELVTHFKWKGAIGCAFPAVIKKGVSYTAANVDLAWIGIDAQELFKRKTKCPVHVLNDADAAGIAEMTFGVGKGHHAGVVILLTLGTGIGSAIFVDGHLVPNTEFGHLNIRGKAAERRASDRVRRANNLGWKRWATRLAEEERAVTLGEAIVLGVLQGLTEFLPVSSSGHLVLAPWVLGWPPHDLAFDTTLHLGTIAAVLFYFSKDVRQLLQGWMLTLRLSSFEKNVDGRLAWWIIIATIPGALIGYTFQGFFEELFALPPWAAFFLLVTAGLLTMCEQFGRRRRDIDSITLLSALGIGLAQAIAIAPGISRSGATIAAAMLFGLKREPAARFSFLLSIPIILGAGTLQLIKLFRHGILLSSLGFHLVGFILAAITGYLCIHFLLTYLRTNSLYPFAVYCALAGISVLCYTLLRA